MSTNPFDRNKTKEARLGEIITEPGEQNQRDAVHIAVVPVMARNNQPSGAHVGVTPDGKEAGTPGGLFSSPVGIVDPFLPNGVKAGETFWLFLYQGQVTTLRHEWTHPAFPAVDKADLHSRDDKKASEEWLRAYARMIKTYEDQPDVAYADFVSDLRNKEIRWYGISGNSLSDLEDAAKLKHHARVALGLVLDFDEFSFGCSC